MAGGLEALPVQRPIRFHSICLALFSRLRRVWIAMNRVKYAVISSTLIGYEAVGSVWMRVLLFLQRNRFIN